MLGFLGTIAFGIAYMFGWASDDAAEQRLRNDSKEKGQDFYFDKNGRMRHTISGRKYTPQEVHEAFFSNEGRRNGLRMEYNKWAKPLIERGSLDPEWYTFYDYIVSAFKNNPVTGRELFPEIDWEHSDPNKPLKNPNYSFWITRDADVWYKERVFDTKEQAEDYYINVVAVKENIVVTERVLREAVYKRSGYIIYDTTGLYKGYGRYIIDKTGEEITN